MPTTTYIFEDRNILKSRVLDASLSETIFYTSTTNGLLHRKDTVISSAAHRALATIHWGAKTFEMRGAARSTKAMKSHSGAFFDTHWRRTWRWDPSTPEYAVEYKDHKWTATQTTTGTLCAVFTSYRAHTARKSEPAALVLAAGLPDAERLFLLMVLLRMEGRRLDTEETRARDIALSATATQGAGSGGMTRSA